MKLLSLATLATLATLIGVPLTPVQSQTDRQCRLGDTDAAWAATHGKPTAFARDAWFYGSSGVYTRSWFTGPPRKPGANYAGYLPAEHSVRYVELVRSGISSDQAHAFVRNVLPADVVLLHRRQLVGVSVETYISQSLLRRLRPILAGGGPCIDPWGYGPGIIKVRFSRHRGGVLRVTIDLGDSYEKPASECPESGDAPN